MNNKFFLLSLCLVISAHFFCIGQITFNKILADSLHDFRPDDIKELSNGNFIVVSQVDAYLPSQSYSSLFLLDKNGEVLNRENISYYNQPCGLFSICENSPNDYVLSGFVKKDGATKLWLYNIDSDLNKLREKTIVLGGFNLAMAKLLKMDDGKIVCFGTVEDTTVYQTPFAFIFLFSSTLDSLQFNVQSNYWAFGQDLIQRNDRQGFYIIGIGFGNGPPGKIISLNNNLQIINSVGMPDVDNMSNIRYCDDKHLIATGERSYAWPSTEVRDIGVLKYDTMFNLIHSKAYGKKDTEDCPGWVKNIAVQSTNSIFIGGTGNLNFGALYANQPSWFMLNHTDTSLSLKWQKFYGGDGYYTLWGIIPTRDSGCLMYGTFWDYQHISEYVNYISVIKVNKDGLLLGTDGKPSALLKDVILYPNPGNERIWAVTGRSDAWIEFLDLNGRKILGKSLSTGHTQIETSVLSPGIYIYRVFDKKGLIQTGKWIKE